MDKLRGGNPHRLVLLDGGKLDFGRIGKSRFLGFLGLSLRLGGPRWRPLHFARFEGGLTRPLFSLSVDSSPFFLAFPFFLAGEAAFTVALLVSTYSSSLSS